ncbi:hypothetical protein BX666DRAFT_1973607 [Dichotomocladium elegans]|nr:hypothetical protein BX666DRAFT_1973607 [Dichotomocladium elegans]
MGGQKAKIKNNALITQFFKKAPPPPPPTPALTQHHNDENALTESEIADQNRRALQHGGLAKKKKPLFRHALAQIVNEDGTDMRRVVLGGLKNMDNASLPAKREPAFSVLSDNMDPPDRSFKKPMAAKTVAMPKGWDCDSEPSAAKAAPADKNPEIPSRIEQAKTRQPSSNNVRKNSTRAEGKCHHDTALASPPSKKAVAPTAEVGKASPITILEEEKQSAVESNPTSTSMEPSSGANNSKSSTTIPEKRPVEDELLITTTKRKVLGPKRPIQQQQQQLLHRQRCKEEDPQKKEHSSKIPHSSSFFDGDNDSESESESAHDEEGLSPREFSISNSVSFPPVPRNHPSTPSPEESSDDLSTIPLTNPEYYEEHPAFPVPRGKSLVEKLGIKEVKEQRTEKENEEEEEEEASSIASSPPSYIV